MSTSLLDVTDLSVRFDTDDGTVHAVDRMSFSLGRGEVLGLVGESGCGKSVTAMSMLRLLPETATISGLAFFEGTDLLTLSPRRLRRVRGKEIAFVFQEPMTSLNPVFSIGRQVGEVLRKHLELSSRAARRRTIELLELVRIPAAAQRVNEYPHQLSGGMRQRVMIAMALACDPKILIADEPTTALDVTVQAEILELLRDLQRDTGMTILLITHNWGVVADLCDRAIVMYAGQIVEQGPVEKVLADPLHPYTQLLLSAVPDPGTGVEAKRIEIRKGQASAAVDPPAGCRFVNRCPIAIDVCSRVTPPLVEARSDQSARCHVTAPSTN